MTINPAYKPVISALIAQLKSSLGDKLSAIWLFNEKDLGGSKYAPIFTVQCIINGDDNTTVDCLKSACFVVDEVMRNTGWAAWTSAVSKARFDGNLTQDKHYIEIRKRGVKVYES